MSQEQKGRKSLSRPCKTLIKSYRQLCYRQTDKQTNIHDRNYIPRRFASSQSWDSVTDYSRSGVVYRQSHYCKNFIHDTKQFGCGIITFTVFSFFTALHMECRLGLAMRILSVCRSVCQTRGLWQNGRKIWPDFYTIRKIFSLVFWEEWVVGPTPYTWNFRSAGPHWSEIADFEPIFAHKSSAVTPSEVHYALSKMSQSWTSYVVPKPFPQGGLKNAVSKN